MIQQERVTIRLPEEHLKRAVPWTRKLVWTLGNLLMLCGVYMLLYVGGLLADEQFNIYAASGTSDVNLPVPAIATPAPTPRPAATAAAPSSTPGAAAAAPSSTPAQSAAPSSTPRAQSAWNVPTLNTGGNELTSAVAPRSFSDAPSTITRIVIPDLNLDKKVVEVGYTVENGLIQWQVDQYRVGHNQGTSNPGGGGNIVLSGHSGGDAYPFNALYYLEKGNLIQLYSNGQLYDYTVTERLVVDEVGQPPEKQIENAQYIQQTPAEMVTMVTCWPLSNTYDENGRFLEKFSQRVIVRAEPTKPAGNVAQPDTQNEDANGWVAR